MSPTNPDKCLQTSTMDIVDRSAARGGRGPT